MAEQKTLVRPLSERLHRKLDEIVKSGDKRRLKLVSDFLDVMIDSENRRSRLADQSRV